MFSYVFFNVMQIAAGVAVGILIYGVIQLGIDYITDKIRGV